MPLNKIKGNMYDFITHTWNTVKGPCPHNCGYCYMDGIRKRFKKDIELYFDESELKTNLGKGNFIFVGSSNDLFAESHPEEWITKTLDYCDKFDNKYLFQSKNPARILKLVDHPIFKKAAVYTTIESDIFYPEIMCNSPQPYLRATAMNLISDFVETNVTIEPVLDFDTDKMVKLIKMCNPKQVNIGANSGHKKFPEPSADKVLNLIEEIKTFATIYKKSNLERIITNGKTKK